MTPPRLLTLAEVTDRLHVSRRTVATLVATRQLPTVIIGTRSTRVRVIDLEEYIEGQVRKAEPDSSPDAVAARTLRARRTRAS